MGKIYVFNSPVLTSWGKFSFEPLSIKEAKELLKGGGFVSAVGHRGTAEAMTSLLGIEIPYDEKRTAVHMEPGDKAVVFRLMVRLPEGKILTQEELEKLPFELGLMLMLEPRIEKSSTWPKPPLIQW